MIIEDTTSANVNYYNFGFRTLLASCITKLFSDGSGEPVRNSHISISYGEEQFHKAIIFTPVIKRSQRVWPAIASM